MGCPAQGPVSAFPNAFPGASVQDYYVQGRGNTTSGAFGGMTSTLHLVVQGVKVKTTVRAVALRGRLTHGRKDASVRQLGGFRRSSVLAPCTLKAPGRVGCLMRQLRKQGNSSTRCYKLRVGRPDTQRPSHPGAFWVKRKEV